MTTVPNRTSDTTLTPDAWAEVKAILRAALDRPRAEREELVVRACGENVALRKEVESLLGAADTAGTFLANPAAVDVSAAASDDDAVRLMAHIAAALGDRYALKRELARGGMSRVFLAEERALARMVVVKLLRPELASGVSAERFAREVRLTARLQQANIVPVLATGDVDGLPWYTMPYVRGASLRAQLASGTQMPVAEACDILKDITKALAYAHTEGVVHRDIKPENVLLSGRTAVVTDFGIAKAIEGARAESRGAADAALDASASSLTSLGTSIGTPAYMAPEQVAGDPELGAAADVYAFGVVAYELLAGVHPFADCRTPHEMLVAHLTRAPLPLGKGHPELPAPLCTLVMRCLEKDPALRPADGGLVLAALEGAELGTSVEFRWWDASTPSLAVLPFANLSGDPADEYLSDGITEEILSALTRMRGLRVAARTSSFGFRNRSVDVPTIARRLGVKTVLEGSVRHAAGRVRIGVRLVSAADGLTLWSGRYDREVADIFAVQDDIGQAIALALEEALGPDARSRTRIASTPRTRPEAVPAEAFEMYLRGRQLVDQRVEGMHEALRCFEQASRLAPDFSPTHAGIAYVYTMFGIYHALRPRDAFPRARDAADRALAIDPTDALALVMRAQVALWHEWAFRTAEAHARRALQLAPALHLAHVGLGYVLAAEGRFDEAIASMQRARELDPLSEFATCDLSWVLILAGRWDQAVRVLQPAVARHPQVSELRRGYGFCLFYAGRLHEARAEFEQTLRLNAGDRWATQNLVQVLAALGEREEARRLLADVERRAGHEPVPLIGIAVMHHWLGEDEQALDWLVRSVEARDSWLVMLPHDPSMARLHGDPRFESIMSRVRA